MAEECKVAVIAIIHHTKTEGRSAAQKILGSVAFNNLARCHWSFFLHPNSLGDDKAGKWVL